MSFRVRGLTRGYGGKPVLDGLDLDLPDGRVVALLGASGSGKTTLLNLLGTLDETRLPAATLSLDPDGGGPTDYAALTAAGRRDLRLRHFGFVLQSCYLLPYLTCRENVALPLRLQGWGRADALAEAGRAVAATGDAELVAAVDRRPDGVSQGQKQRFAVLRAVVHRPRVVFADEPTSNLDARSTERMVELLLAWHADAPPAAPRTLVLVCHNLSTAQAVGDEFLLLDGGKAGLHFGRGEWDCHRARLGEVLGSAATLPPADAGGPAAPFHLPPPPPRPARRPGPGFYARLAFRDLLDARHRGTGLLVLLTVALVALLAVWAWAWPTLAEQRRLRAAAAKPQANLLFVDPQYAQLAGRIPDETRQKLAADLAAALGDRLVGVYPSRELSLGLEVGPGGAAAPRYQSIDPPRGRTVTGPDDPLVKSAAVRFGRGIDGPDDGGVVVCPRFLEGLGLPTEPPPAVPFARRVLDDGGHPLTIVGVAAGNFAQGVGYLATEAERGRRDTRRLDRERLVEALDTETLPEPWVAFLRADGRLRGLKDWADGGDRQVRLELTRSGDGVKFRLRRDGRSLADWATFAESLRGEASRLDPSAALPPLALTRPESVAAAAPPPAWTGVTVHVRDLSALPEAIRVVKSHGLQVNETVADQLLTYREAAEEARAMMAWTLAFVLAIVAINLGTIQTLRLGRKKAENALLRAVGMGRGQLTLVYVAQAVGLGLFGVGSGLALGGGLLLAGVAADDRHALLASGWPERSLGTALALGLLLVVAAWFANRIVSAGSPSRGLSGG